MVANVLSEFMALFFLLTQKYNDIVPNNGTLKVFFKKIITDMEEKSTEKLARYTMYLVGASAILAVCWFLRSVIVYILIAAVMMLVSKPLMKRLRKLTIKGRQAPEWLLAIFTILLIIAIILSIMTLIIPAIGNVVNDISMANIGNAAKQITAPLASFNEFLISIIPNLGQDFRIERFILNEVQSMLDISSIPSVIGSAASFLSSLGVGLFSVVFISFFFIKDDDLFTKIIKALVPDRHEQNVAEAISDIGHLLSRYFSGVILQVLGVAAINFLGLLLIAKLGFNASIGIAFITGILNIIPYVGPLVGGVLGTILGVTLKYFCATPIGLDVGFITFTLILIAIFCVTQLVDNFLYQPIIYSSSIKANPLEIFIVLLIAGSIAGPLAMIIAIPCYTVVRVIAYRFFGNIKAINRLIHDNQQ